MEETTHFIGGTSKCCLALFYVYSSLLLNIVSTNTVHGEVSTNTVHGEVSTNTVHGEVSEISNGVVEFEDYYKPIWSPEKITSFSTRKRRNLGSNVKINFINKSGREVRVFQVGLFGFFVLPKFDLRPNEPRALDVSSGTVWEVRDMETGFYMLTNGRKRFEVRGKGSKKFLDLRIRRPYFLKRKLTKFDKLPEKYLRVMVIADETVKNFHGEEKSRKLIMTIMSAVSRIFQDKSLGIKMNIILTKIFLMDDKQRSFRIFENDPDASIRNACSYAVVLARKNRATNHNFVAILTRKPIGPSGYAAMYTMCTRRSCSIVKENGFNTAYVIAHEAGHALGIDHDGEDGECKKDQLQGSIMAPNVYSKHKKYHWSFCSKRSLYENIKYFPCLNKKYKESENNEVDKFYDLPGEISTKTDQCKRNFGIRATGCYVYYDTCEFLLCKKSRWSGCAILPRISPLEGTSCGNNKWCIKGKCVVKKKEKAVVHGNWGSWTIFGPCKGFCGAGIRTRTRRCDNPPPKRGGRQCRGKDTNVEACNLEKCWPHFSKESERSRKCKVHGKSWREYSMKLQNENLKNANISCDFEDSSCGWGNDFTNRQKWLLNSGPTKSAGTGPTNDNTFGTREGAYVYFEASWVNRYFKPSKGTKSKLISQSVFLSTVCFSFYYHMYGANMGHLNLFSMNEKKSLKLIWRKEGQQGNGWFHQALTIKSTEKYQLVFEAIRGNGYQSDIALDDIKIVAGACKKYKEAEPPSCTIECISPTGKNLQEVAIEDGFPCHLDSSLDLCYQGKCLVRYHLPAT